MCKQTLYYDVANGDMANERVYKCDQTVKQIEAFDTGFVILYEDGTVATMGDPRFENCLGRIVTETAWVPDREGNERLAQQVIC